MNFDQEKEKDLTACEALIMKAVWNSEEDISTVELQKNLKEGYGKEYALTTIRTFLTKLSDKGFIKNYRRGKNAFVHPLKSEEEYKEQQLKKQTDFWYSGRTSNLICAAFKSADHITKEDADKIRGILDEWDKRSH
ncbi:MAG: BlaI/MecI/CopY family transcriptional regulator [Lachnospiraceae bacterium]|jgi:predicted transcriptional regulator|nr:BlaI/MecI/CopY family transcriptional regulator [Lachnospiraceae bacterium]